MDLSKLMKGLKKTIVQEIRDHGLHVVEGEDPAKPHYDILPALSHDNV